MLLTLTAAVSGVANASGILDTQTAEYSRIYQGYFGQISIEYTPVMLGINDGMIPTESLIDSS